jgi:hypothetical protein
MDDPNNALTPIKDALKDGKRIKYHNDYLTNLLASIKYGSLAYMPRHMYVPEIVCYCKQTNNLLFLLLQRGWLQCERVFCMVSFG